MYCRCHYRRNADDGLQTAHYARYRYLGGPVRSDAEMATALANPDQWEQL